MRVALHRSLNAILLIFLVTATTTACGITGITAMAGSVRTRTLTIPLPLDGKSADQIAMMSLNDLGNATSVELSGTFDESGSRSQMTVTLVKGVGCAGTIEEQGQGSFRLIVRGKVAWMKADTAFLRAQGASGSVLNTLTDNYIKVTSKSFITQFSQLCSVATNIASQSSGATGLTQARVIMNGRAVVKLMDARDTATMVVSDSVTPELLQVNDPGPSGGSFTFSDFNKPASIAPPPTDQTLDGAQFGL
jgi:hypothetical protein